jgi:limonene-1,2-epoxide hydrolase
MNDADVTRFLALLASWADGNAAFAAGVRELFAHDCIWDQPPLGGTTGPDEASALVEGLEASGFAAIRIECRNVATAGGVIFTGDADRYLKAFDQTNGKQLWQSRLNDVVNAWPITYSVKGKQYVAVITGCCGNGRINNMHQLTPEIEQPKPTSSVVWVFALPDANGQ